MILIISSYTICYARDEGTGGRDGMQLVFDDIIFRKIVRSHVYTRNVQNVYYYLTAPMGVFRVFIYLYTAIRARVNINFAHTSAIV